MKQTIFVMIPSYRDPVLKETLDTMFELADNPNRVFAAIAAQYDDEVPMPDLSKYPAKQIRVLSIHPEGRPSIFRLRHILNKLYFGEDYYLSIDSHTIFKKGWDTDLINLLESHLYYKTIISCYEGDTTSLTDEYESLDMKLDESDPVVTGPRLFLPHSTQRPWRGEKFVRSVYIQAGMFFTRGEFAKDIAWGQYWQNEQEEPFLSFQAFMTGWRHWIHLQDHPFTHEPQKYYDAVYSSAPNSVFRSFKDDYSHLSDHRSSVCKQIMRAYLYNEGPYAVKNVVKKTEHFWIEAGLATEFDRLTSDNERTAY